MEFSLDTAEPPAQCLLLFSNLLANIDIVTMLILGVITLLVFLSAIISGSEVAFFSIEKGKLLELENSELAKERSVYSILKNPKKLLATILILNNLINISIVSFVTVLVWKVTGTRDTPAIVVSVVTAISTFLIVFFGELLPKVYANQNAINFSKKIVQPLLILNKILFPLSYLLINSTNIIEKRFSKNQKSLTSDELNKAIELTTNSNEVTQEEKEILRGIANFNNITSKQIMRDRTEIEAFDIEIHFHELMDKINKTGYSRIPIFEETIDSIVGVLYIKDLLPYTQEEEDFNWRKFIKTPYFIPETKKINDLLKNFQQKRVHMAVVVDEYGGTSGLITLEDIIEEIVGEINDEFDDAEINFTRISSSEFVFEAKTLLHDFCKVLDLDADFFDEVQGENESLGGLMLELFSKMPNVGQEVVFNQFNFTIESVSSKRIIKVRVKMNETKKAS